MEADLAKLHEQGSMLSEEVSEEDVAEVVARWTGIPVSKLMEGETEKAGPTRRAPSPAGGWPRPRGRGRVQRGASLKGRPVRPQQAGGLVPLPGPNRCGQDRAGSSASPIPLRRRAVDGSHRYVGVHGKALREPSNWSSSRDTSVTTRVVSSPRPSVVGPTQSSCSTRLRRPTQRCSTSCFSCWTMVVSPTDRAGRWTSATSS